MDDGGETAMRGEQLACEYLEGEGWEIWERNWTKKIGEIDIIGARIESWGSEEVTLVAFFEVKTRQHSRGPLPEVRVDATKRRKLVTLGKLYLAERQLRRSIARFDVIGVDLDVEQIRHHAAAFDASGRLR